MNLGFHTVPMIMDTQWVSNVDNVRHTLFGTNLWVAVGNLAKLVCGAAPRKERKDWMSCQFVLSVVQEKKTSNLASGRWGNKSGKGVTSKGWGVTPS